jgi:hypothetical protein
MNGKSFKMYPIGYGKMKRTLKTHFRFPIGYKLPINGNYSSGFRPMNLASLYPSSSSK